jgi:hypothetical protein
MEGLAKIHPNSENKGKLWVRLIGKVWALYVEIWRRPNDLLEVMPFYDYAHPNAPCRQVFDIHMSDLHEATKIDDVIYFS